MPWSIAAPIAGAVVSSALSKSGSSSNGGAGTTTNTKEPWLQAQPWITNNMTSGQALQNQYATTPFNQQQLGAYNNLANQTNYINQVVPSLLGQLSGQQVGFNRSNPTAMPTAYNFNGVGNTTGATAGNAGNPGAGLLAQLAAPAPTASSAANPPAAAPAPAPAASTFVDQPNANNYANAAAMFAQGANQKTGGYGSFKYGDQPTPGTQAYADMNTYLAYGGSDPKGLYTKGANGQLSYGQAMGDGTSSSNAPASGTGGLF